MSLFVIDLVKNQPCCSRSQRQRKRKGERKRRGSIDVSKVNVSHDPTKKRKLGIRRQRSPSSRDAHPAKRMISSANPAIRDGRQTGNSPSGASHKPLGFKIKLGKRVKHKTCLFFGILLNASTVGKVCATSRKEVCERVCACSFTPKRNIKAMTKRR